MRTLTSILKNKTSIHIYINTFGQYLNIGFVVIYTALLFNIMSATEYGIFGVLTTVSYLLTNILDFGTPATIYSYLPPLLPAKSGNLFKFVKSIFFYQTLFASVVIVLLIALYPTLDFHFLKTGAQYIDMIIASLAILLFVWQNFFLNLYFAAKRFLKANMFLNLVNIIRIGCLLAVYLTNSISITSVLLAINIVPNIIFILLILNDRKAYLATTLRAKVDRKEFRFSYTFTFFVASQFLNSGQRADLLILSYFNTIITRPEVGLYAAAQKVIITLLTTIISITQVLSPGFSTIKTQYQARKQMKHGLLYMLIPCGLFVGVVLTPQFIFDLFFTETFSKAADIARMLSLPNIMYALGSIPMLLLLYTVKKPRPILLAYVLFFVIVGVGNYILIPYLKIVAPPLTMLVGYLVSNGIIAYAAWKEYLKMPER